MRLNQCRTHDIRIREFEDASNRSDPERQTHRTRIGGKGHVVDFKTFSGKQAKGPPAAQFARRRNALTADRPRANGKVRLGE